MNDRARETEYLESAAVIHDIILKPTAEQAKERLLKQIDAVRARVESGETTGLMTFECNTLGVKVGHVAKRGESPYLVDSLTSTAEYMDKEHNDHLTKAFKEVCSGRKGNVED